MHEDAILSQYEIGSRIGSGAFSQVYFANHIPTSSNVAVKIIDYEKLEVDDKTGAIREIAALLQLDHPSIISLYNFSFSDDKLYIFLEYLPQGNLLDKVNRTHGISEDQARKYFKDIISGLLYLHQAKGIVHRDLKLQNMMLSTDDHVKLIDFGFCNSTLKNNLFQTFVGTPGFTAPEIIKSDSHGYNELCDIFSLGACLYAMVAGRRPFDLQNKNKDLLVEQINNLEYPEDKFSPDLQSILRGMLNADPSSRMTIDQIISSAWFHSYESRPSLGLKSFIDIRRFTTKESLAMISRKNLLKPNTKAIMALTKFGYSADKVVTELRRGRITDGTAAYLMMIKTLPPEELNDELILTPDFATPSSMPKKMPSPIITIPTSICVKKSKNHKFKTDATLTKYQRVTKSFHSRLYPL